MMIMIVADDPALVRSLDLIFKSAGWGCYAAADVDDAVSAAHAGGEFDAIVVDLDFTEANAVEAMRQMRRRGVKTPFLALIGVLGAGPFVEALAVGADVVVRKPFHKDELVAQCNVLGRRSHGLADSVVAAGDISINLDQRYVEHSGRKIPLTGKEFTMLELLALRKDRLVTKEMLLRHCYGGRDEPEIKIVDVFVCKIRKKIMKAVGVNVIETVWGRGYMLRNPDICPPIPDEKHHKPMGVTKALVASEKSEAEREAALERNAAKVVAP